jgi:hypothetical protein
MSTSCSFCIFDRLKRRAKGKNRLISIETVDGLKGVFVYIHPSRIDIKDLSKEEKRKYFISWLPDLPNHCTCIR